MLLTNYFFKEKKKTASRSAVRNNKKKKRALLHFAAYCLNKLIKTKFNCRTCYKNVRY